MLRTPVVDQKLKATARYTDPSISIHIESNYGRHLEDIYEASEPSGGNHGRRLEATGRHLEDSFEAS